MTLAALRRSIAFTLALAASFALPRGLEAQGAKDFPSKPITFIVPWNAGGSTDLLFRGLCEAASRQLGQPIVIDNKVGGSGVLGPANMALAAKPDGYTIAQIPISVLRLPYMQKQAFDPLTDFTYIVHVSGYLLGVTAKADGPFKTWADVIARAKELPPGKLTYGTNGPATSPHIGMEQIAEKSGVKFTMVPFKGGPETNAAVLGGHTDLQADSTSWATLVDGGQLRLLMVWSETRSKRWPNVPTLKELGYPFVFDSPFGIAGPKGMDPAVVARLHDAFKAALDDPKVGELMEKYDFVKRYMSTADYQKFVPQFIASERAALEKIGLAKKE